MAEMEAKQSNTLRAHSDKSLYTRITQRFLKLLYIRLNMVNYIRLNKIEYLEKVPFGS